jgi:hypothetical protein
MQNSGTLTFLAIAFAFLLASSCKKHDTASGGPLPEWLQPAVFNAEVGGYQHISDSLIITDLDETTNPALITATGVSTTGSKLTLRMDSDFQEYSSNGTPALADHFDIGYVDSTGYQYKLQSAQISVQEYSRARRYVKVTFSGVFVDDIGLVVLSTEGTAHFRY